MQVSAVVDKSRRRAGRQKGSAAIEFAFIFPALFLVFYAIVTYGLMFAAQHTLTLAVAEGARAAVRYQPGAVTVRQATAASATQGVLGWLSQAAAGAQVSPIAVTTEARACPYASSLTCVYVRARYDYKAKPLVPALAGLPVSDILQAEAVAQVSLGS